MLSTIITMIIAVVAGFYFIKKFPSIEHRFFGNGDTDDEEASGVIFLYACTAIGALATAWGFIAGIFDLSFRMEGIIYAGVSLVAIVMFGSMVYSTFHNMGVGQMIGKMAFMAFSCVVGALMGAAGSVILFGILIIVLFFYIFGAALSGSGSSSSSSSSSSDASSSSSSNDDEFEISVDGEMFNRKARDVGFGKIRDDHGDTWRRNIDGSFEHVE